MDALSQPSSSRNHSTTFGNGVSTSHHQHNQPKRLLKHKNRLISLTFSKNTQKICIIASIIGIIITLCSYLIIIMIGFDDEAMPHIALTIVNNVLSLYKPFNVNLDINNFYPITNAKNYTNINNPNNPSYNNPKNDDHNNFGNSIIPEAKYFETESNSQNQLPNIIFILSDDQGWDDVSYHRYSQIKTPHIDNLVYEYGGLELNQYYIQCVCTPSRGALLTGRYPIHTGLTMLVSPGSSSGLALDFLTIGDIFNMYSNYDTYYVGKWHVGHHKWRYTPTWRGFNEFYGFYSGAQDYFTHQRSSFYDFSHDKEFRCQFNCTRVVTEAYEKYSVHMFNDYVVNQILPKYGRNRDELKLRLKKEREIEKEKERENAKGINDTQTQKEKENEKITESLFEEWSKTDSKPFIKSIVNAQAGDFEFDTIDTISNDDDSDDDDSAWSMFSFWNKYRQRSNIDNTNNNYNRRLIADIGSRAADIINNNNNNDIDVNSARDIRNHPRGRPDRPQRERERGPLHARRGADDELGSPYMPHLRDNDNDNDNGNHDNNKKEQALNPLDNGNGAQTIGNIGIRDEIGNSRFGTNPFFLFLSYQSVHSPLQVPEHYIYDNSTIKDYARRKFAGMASCMDESIGNITNKLKELNLWENTIVIFTSDNGGATMTADGIGSRNYPLRGAKHSVWEGGTRVVGAMYIPPYLHKKNDYFYSQIDYYKHIAKMKNQNQNQHANLHVNDKNLLRNMRSMIETDDTTNDGTANENVHGDDGTNDEEKKEEEEGGEGENGNEHIVKFYPRRKNESQNITYNYIMHGVDWLPTLLEAANISLNISIYKNNPIDGVSHWQSMIKHVSKSVDMNDDDDKQNKNENENETGDDGDNNDKQTDFERSKAMYIASMNDDLGYQAFMAKQKEEENDNGNNDDNKENIENIENGNDNNRRLLDLNGLKLEKMGIFPDKPEKLDENEEDLDIIDEKKIRHIDNSSNEFFGSTIFHSYMPRYIMYYGHNVPNKRGSPGSSSALRWFDMKLILGSNKDGGGDPIGWNLPPGNEPEWEKPKEKHQGTNIGGKHYLLFNLSSDPFERNEISQLFPNITFTMSQMLRKYEGGKKRLATLNCQGRNRKPQSFPTVGKVRGPVCV